MDVVAGVFPRLAGVPVSVQAALVVAVFALVAWTASTFTKNRPYAGFPVISVPGKSALHSWIENGGDVIKTGVKTGAPFQVMTGTGPKIILPNRYASEVKSDPRLAFNEAVAQEFFSHMSGFEPFAATSKDPNMIPEVIRTNLTQSLGLVTPDLVEEALSSIHDCFGEDSEWHSVPAKQHLLTVIARLSSRVFLGKDLCRNEGWLKVAKEYTVSSFVAARELRKVHPLLRPVAHLFMKHSNEIREQYRTADKLITPEIERRRERAAKALAAGQKPPKTADTIGWIHEKSRGEPIDYVAAQLGLTLAAIHTTTEATMDALVDICSYPELQDALRKEAVEVLQEEGWTRAALYKLRLMDSFLKESQRYHPNSSVSMTRLVKDTFTLSDGVVLPKGAKIMTATRYFDRELYSDADKFDAYRFLRLREASETQSTHQHVTVSPDHLAFGYGKHACPGRFFASNEIKIALTILLLKYEWSFEKGQTADQCFFATEASLMTLPNVSLRARRRKEEIPLDIDLETVAEDA